MPDTRTGSYITAANTALPLIDNIKDDSLDFLLQQVAGRYVTKSITLSGNGATTTNLFLVTGGMRILELSFNVTAVTDSTTFSNVKFQLYDGTVATDLTAVVNGSGCLAGSFFAKNDVAASALLYMNNTTGAFADAVLASALAPFYVVAKSGASTYLRVAFTGDANTNIAVLARCRYVRMVAGSKITAV